MRAFVVFVFALFVLASPVAAAGASSVDLPPNWRTPSALAFAPDGALWLALEGSWALGRFAREGAEAQLFPLPPPSGGKGSLWGLAVTNESVVYAASGEALYRVGRNGTEAFPFPVRAEIPGDLLVDPEGDVWVALTDADAFVEFDPATGSFTRVNATAGTGPLGLTLIGEGLAAFTATYANTLGILDTRSGRVTMRTVDVAGPVGIAATSKEMWVGEMGASSFARVSGAGVVHYPTSASPFYPISGPTGILVAQDGAVWFAEHFADRVARFDPATETLVEYAIATTPGANVQRVAEAPDGRVWATLTSHDKLAVLDHDAALAPPDVPRALSGPAGEAVRLAGTEGLEVATDPRVVASRAGDASELRAQVEGASKVLVSRADGNVRVGRYATLETTAAATGGNESPGLPLALALVALALLAVGRRRR